MYIPKLDFPCIRSFLQPIQETSVPLRRQSVVYSLPAVTTLGMYPANSQWLAIMLWLGRDHQAQASAYRQQLAALSQSPLMPHHLATPGSHFTSPLVYLPTNRTTYSTHNCRSYIGNLSLDWISLFPGYHLFNRISENWYMVYMCKVERVHIGIREM